MSRFASAAVVLSLTLTSGAFAQASVDYARQVKPLLKERCYSCHGALKQKAKLRLDTVQAMRGAGILDGELLERVTTKDADRRMPPPSEGEPLTAKQIELLRSWIRKGAPGMANEQPEPDPREHWAFRKPVRPGVPTVANQAWVRNPIDSFIAAEHAKQGLTALPAAEPGLLLRRVYLDLIGLPPTREELHAFLAECASAKPQAYEKVVDRLLASPHYGERWGRHWMDVWRYSDWYGRRHVPDVWNSAPQIWRWRDWIVRSLNADQGYDRMIQEMLAADEIAPEDDDAQAATGYIVRNWYALNPHQWKRDMVEHTGKAFLGLTFNCAHCHDHKYDPIAHEDYFRLRAFFEPIELRQDRVPGEGDPGPFQKYDYSTLRKIARLGAVRVYDDRLEAKTLMYTGGDERNLLKERPPMQPGGPAFLAGDRLKIEAVELPLLAYYPALKPFAVQEEIARRVVDLKKAATASQIAIAQAELQAYRARVQAAQAAFPKPRPDADALAMAAAHAERLAAHLAAKDRWAQADASLAKARDVGASKESKDKEAGLASVKKMEPQVAALKKALDQAEKNLSLKDGKYTPLGPIYPRISSGRRKALALWITSPDNPLTARVAVNHVWMRHFDRPLVDSVFDFGRNGKKPSHPELLDWLAVEFMESGWRMQHLHRLIVTSATYRMQSATPHPLPLSPKGRGENAARDPDNRWYWRANARRMEAEIVRDCILASAGELDRTVGGMVLENKEETTSKRRSLYFSIFPEDGGHLKFLEIFDAPDPCDCYRRMSSVMPQQALALANNALVLQQSRQLARKLSLGATDDAAFITAALEHLLSRPPSKIEAAACTAFLAKQRELYRSANPKDIAASPDPTLRARESLTRVLYNHNDFITIR